MEGKKSNTAGSAYLLFGRPSPGRRRGRGRGVPGGEIVGGARAAAAEGGNLSRGEGDAELVEEADGVAKGSCLDGTLPSLAPLYFVFVVFLLLAVGRAVVQLDICFEGIWVLQKRLKKPLFSLPSHGRGGGLAKS